jgi:hypothetical protein
MEGIDPYLQGKADHARGVPRRMNPYEDDPKGYGTELWESWFEGWDDAEDEKATISKPALI